MAAPKGNQFWKLRSKHGRDALFASPELLWETACEYFEWCDNHPWNKVDFKGRDNEQVLIPTPRPYSKAGLFTYIDCSENWLLEFRKVASRDFLRVIERIERVIATQQWEGATVGAFNSNIISRTLGLKERTEHSGDEENPVTFKNITFGSD